MSVDTWIRQQDGTVDDQAQINEPYSFSWLKSDHCFGSEETLTPLQENGWIPVFS